MSSASSKRPKLIVFDLDYTLWPFWVDTHVTPPFKKVSNKVIDFHGEQVRYFPEVPKVLERLKNDDYQLAVASRTGEIDGANQLLKLFDWDKYFSYKEIYPGSKVTHFSQFRKHSGISFKEMLFFDDEQRNIKDLKEKGVCSILVRNGVNMQVVEDGLKTFEKGNTT